jgi:hypothetical protein
MKHYILLKIEFPVDDAEAIERESRWKRARESLAAHAQPISGIEQLGPDCWLIPRDPLPPFLAECIAAAQTNGLRVCMRFFLE